jgi:hypothetical protein
MNTVHSRARLNNLKPHWNMLRWKESEKSNTIASPRRSTLFLIVPNWNGVVVDLTAATLSY